MKKQVEKCGLYILRSEFMQLLFVWDKNRINVKNPLYLQELKDDIALNEKLLIFQDKFHCSKNCFQKVPDLHTVWKSSLWHSSVK
jgi:hypothetical protein